MTDLTEKAYEDAITAFRTQNPDAPLTMRPTHWVVPRPELQKDAKGLFPGEAKTGVPDFLRRTETISPATDLPASAPSWAPPWSTNS